MPPPTATSPLSSVSADPAVNCNDQLQCTHSRDGCADWVWYHSDPSSAGTSFHFWTRVVWGLFPGDGILAPHRTCRKTWTFSLTITNETGSRKWTISLMRATMCYCERELDAVKAVGREDRPHPHRPFPRDLSPSALSLTSFSPLSTRLSHSRQASHFQVIDLVLTNTPTFLSPDFLSSGKENDAMPSSNFCDECNIATTNISRHRRIKHKDTVEVITSLGHKQTISRTDGVFRCIYDECEDQARDPADIVSHVDECPNAPPPPQLPAPLQTSIPLQLPTPPLNTQAPLPTAPSATSDTEDVEMVDDTTNANEDTTPIPATQPREAPLTEDTIQTDQMEKAGIIVNSALRIVICLGCRAVVKPAAIYGHVGRDHSLPVRRNFCQGLTATYNLHKEPTRPGKVIDAIYGLDIIPDYWSCDNCGAAFQTDASMSRHHRDVLDCRPATHTKRPAQSYFPSSNRLFFGVTLPAPPPSHFGPNPVSLIKNAYLPTPFEALPIQAIGFRDATHFLTIEKWTDHVAGMTGEGIYAIVREREPELRVLVRKVVLAYAREAVADLGGADNSVKVAIGDYNGIGYTTNKLRALTTEGVTNYSGAVVDLVVFALGVINDSMDTWKRTVYSAEIEEAGSTFTDAIRSGTDDDLKDALQSLIFSIFNQKRTAMADKYSTLVYSFIVLYSYRREGNLNKCNVFSQYMSRVIWFGRVSIYNRIKDETKGTDLGFFDVYEKYKPNLLIQSNFPLSSLYHSKNLARKISEDQELDHKVSLSTDKQTAVLGSISIHISSFGAMYRALVAEIGEKQQDLFGGVEFEDPEWFGFTVPEIIADDNNRSQPGYFFGDHASNQDFLRYEDLGLKVLFEHPRLRGRYGCVRSSDQKLILNTIACQDFFRQASEIRSKLASACHISLGGPPRGTEFAANYLKNHPGGDVRNVRFIFSTLCFVSGYNKSSLSTEKQKVIFRFVPKTLERLFLIEWLIIRPTEIFLASYLQMHEAVEELRFKLFPSTTNQPFTSGTLSKGLKRDTHLYLGHGFGIKEYRDFQVTFSRHHPDPRPRPSNQAEVADAQRGHSSNTAVTWYGLDETLPQGVAPWKITGFEQASNWWNYITGQDTLKAACEIQISQEQANGYARLESSISERVAGTTRGCIQEMRSEILEAIGVGFSTLPATTRVGSNHSEPAKTRAHPHPSLLTNLSTFLSKPNASFKTPEQAEALEVTINRKEHLLLIGPTAMGKSLVYMLPAALFDRALVTLVLLPLSSLHADFARRCKEHKIPSSRWEPGLERSPDTPIVYVSPEHAQMKEFLDYATSLHLTKKLARVVIDEPHLAVQHANFRYCFSFLKPLISARVPFLLLTATCPPTLMIELLSTLAIRKCRVIRAPTNRPEISYNVKTSRTLDDAKRLLLKAVEERLKTCSSNFRGLVYCRGRNTVDVIAEAIGCDPFHSDRPEEERKKSFADWVAGKNKFIVSTSLLGCGIDVEGVEVVYHYLTPWSVMDFVQESGRAGRGGGWAESCVFASEMEFENDVPKDLFGYAIMKKWVIETPICRRIALSSFLDGHVTTCTLLPNANLCDVCQTAKNAPHPRHPVEVSPTVTPPDCIPKIGPLPPVPPASIEYARERLEAPPQTNDGITMEDSNQDPPSGSDNDLEVDLDVLDFTRLSDHPSFLKVVMRAAKTLALQKASRPHDEASLTIEENARTEEMDREIAAEIVRDARRHVEATPGTCAVCYALRGVSDRGHKAGNACKRMPLQGAEWDSFRKGLEIPRGTSCFRCLLPTNTKTNVPGAEYHDFSTCKNLYFIQQALFAFWKFASTDMKDFIRTNLGVDEDWKDITPYKEWLVARRADTFNYLYLYWWMFVYHNLV